MLCRSNMVQVRADAAFTRENGDGSISCVVAYFRTTPQLVADSHPLDMDAILLSLSSRSSTGTDAAVGLFLTASSVLFSASTPTGRSREARTFNTRMAGCKTLCRQRTKRRRDVLSVDRALCSASSNTQPPTSFAIPHVPGHR